MFMHHAMLVSMHCLFVSDLHGSTLKYNKLISYIKKNKPDAVFFGGDLLPMCLPPSVSNMKSFISETITRPLQQIKQILPDIHFFVILGNDDPRVYESFFKQADADNIIDYVHQKTVPLNDFYVTGYAFVPPTPFQLKDWERYDVSRFVDVGAISPEDGTRTVPVDRNKLCYATIQKDLNRLVKNAPVDKTIFLFHSPPYNTVLDLADLAGKTIDHAPVDDHIGSIAIKRFIEKYQPFLTLHGHVHESSLLTGKWQQRIGETLSFSAAFTNDKLAVVAFDTNNLRDATRHLICI